VCPSAKTRRIGLVHEYRALTHQIAVLFQDDVTDGEHERMTGGDHLSEGNTRTVERADGFLGETGTLVALQDRGEFTAVAPGDKDYAEFADH